MDNLQVAHNPPTVSSLAHKLHRLRPTIERENYPPTHLSHYIEAPCNTQQTDGYISKIECMVRPLDLATLAHGLTFSSGSYPNSRQIAADTVLPVLKS